LATAVNLMLKELKPLKMMVNNYLKSIALPMVASFKGLVLMSMRTMFLTFGGLIQFSETFLIM